MAINSDISICVVIVQVAVRRPCPTGIRAGQMVIVPARGGQREDLPPGPAPRPLPQRQAERAVGERAGGRRGVAGLVDRLDGRGSGQRRAARGRGSRDLQEPADNETASPSYRQTPTNVVKLRKDRMPSAPSAHAVSCVPGTSPPQASRHWIPPVLPACSPECRTAQAARWGTEGPGSLSSGRVPRCVTGSNA